MSKKETAVEWVEKQLNLIREKGDDLIWQYAKQMEKEQMKEAHLIADHYPRGYEFEQYYKETYERENN